MKMNKLLKKWLLLIFCYSIVSSQPVENYPDEINCIISKYLTGFSGSQEVQNNATFIERSLNDLIEWGVIKRNQVISIRFFVISGGLSTLDHFSVIIWEMQSPEDAVELSKSLQVASKGGRIREHLEKPPKTFFVFEKFFIWIKAWSFATQFDVRNERNRIVRMCFE
jgi:hypothetical protein